jgi:hypothetical protein
LSSFSISTWIGAEVKVRAVGAGGAAPLPPLPRLSHLPLPPLQQHQTLHFIMIHCSVVPDFYPFRIPDPKTATKERGEKNLLSHLFCSHKFHKIENYFYFLNAEENNFSQFSKNYRTFYPKICH